MKKKLESYLSENESERTGKNRIITFKTLFVSVLWFLVISFFSCGIDKDQPDNQPKEVPPVAINEQQCIYFAEKLHQSFADSNANYLNSYVAWNSLKKEICDSKEKEQMFDSLRVNWDIGNDFIGITYGHSDVRFITYYEEEGSHHIVFRVFDPPQSIAFYDFQLVGSDNKISIADIYDYDFGRSLKGIFSNELRIYNQCEKPWVECYLAFKNFKQTVTSLMEKGQLKLAYAYFKENKNLYEEHFEYTELYRAFIEHLGDAKLMTNYLLERVQKLPLGSNGRWLPLFYANALSGNYGDAQIALANLEAEVGKDTYLHFLRGNLFFEQEDYVSAVNSFNEALSTKEEAPVLHLGKVLSYIELEEFTKAVESLLVMSKYYKATNEEWMQEFADYPIFEQSEEFKEFLERNSD